MQLDLELYREETEVEPGVTISYIDIAPERPLRTFLLIHGFGGNATQWQYQLEIFSQHNRVLAIDLRGHGQSSTPETGYDMDHLTADIMAVLKHLNLRQKIVIAGHSFGVAIATELAFRFPDRFSHLILIAGAGEYRIRPAYRLAFRLPESFLSFAQRWVDHFVDASLPAMKEMYRTNVRSWCGWELFPQLKPPVLLILGNKDQVLPQQAYERVAELIPPGKSEVINVDVSAHMVMLERRSAVNRAISRFVESQPVATEGARWRTRFDTVSRGSLLRERPWLAYYETDVPATIHVPDQTLTHLLISAARRFPRRSAVISPGATLTYQNLLDQTLRFANALRSFDLARGARVMLLLPNTPQMIIAYYGTLEAGGVVVMCNPQAPEEDLIHQAQESMPEILVTTPTNSALAAAVRDQSTIQHIILAAPGDYHPWYLRLWNSLTGAYSSSDHPPADGGTHAWRTLLHKFGADSVDIDLAARDLALIQYTSGTSGKPKGVMLSHRNLLANALQITAWLSESREGLETYLAVTPISHILGSTTVMNVPIMQGACMVLLSRFHVREVLEAIKNHKPTYFPGVPAMYLALNNFPDIRKYNIQSIRACLSSGAPLPIEVEEAFEKLARARLVESYGLTETSPLTHSEPIHGHDKVGSIGVPLPSTEARIVDLQTRKPLLPGEIGELAVRGPQVMLGYWQDDEATSAAIDELGWFYTGDIARMDEDGYFQIISRSQDMGRAQDGEEIFPRDIEEILYELPAVEEPIVVIIAGRPVAFIRLKEDVHLTTATVIAYCQRRLPADHVPWRIVFVSEFPRSVLGRVLRRNLVAEYEDRLQAGAGGLGRYLPGLQESLDVHQ